MLLSAATPMNTNICTVFHVHCHTRASNFYSGVIEILFSKISVQLNVIMNTSLSIAVHSKYIVEPVTV